jgi:uncharacterized protein (TIGR03435 family)
VKKLILWISVLAALPAGALQAQNIVGTWQGELKAPVPKPPRIVVQISMENDRPKGVTYSIDQAGGQPFPASAISFDGSVLKMTVATIAGSYEGRLSADGNSITGTWNAGGQPLPLILARATPETAWTIPDPPPPVTLMSKDAKPSFEVATIKPSKPEERFSLLVNRSGMMNTTNTSLSDLIKFAYGVHPRQITGGPAWIETERYTISAKPDTAGMPNPDQLKAMVQKLLSERFELVFHRDKKELPVYAITVTKTGHKLTKADNPLGLPGFSGGGPRGMLVRNATIEELAGVLQSNVLERPVVDQTGLGSVRWDFTLKWTPDASQIALAGAPQNPPAPDADAPPDIFAAFQQQLGLKLDSAKAPVDVLVIDKVERPSAN